MSKGLVVWDLQELELHSEYWTERDSRLVRSSEATVLIGKKITIPVSPSEADCILHAVELHPETAKVCVELHLQRKIGSGALFFEANRGISRTIFSIDELLEDTLLVSPSEELLIEKSQAGGVTVTLNQRGPAQHHFLLAHSSPGNCATESAEEYLTPVHAYKKSVAIGKGGQAKSGQELATANTTTSNASLRFKVAAMRSRMEKKESAKVVANLPSISSPTPTTPVNTHVASHLEKVEPAAPCPGFIKMDEAAPITGIAEEPLLSQGHSLSIAPPPPPPPPLPQFSDGIPLPPPPPPPAGHAMLGTNTCLASKGAKLRKLHWKPVNVGWANTSADSPVKLQIDREEFNDLFEVSPIKTKATKTKSAGTAGASMLISFKRVNMAGIVLSRILRDGVDVMALKESVIKLDHDALTMDQLRSLRSLFPLSDTERRQLLRHAASAGIAGLTVPEQFYYVFEAQIGRVTERLDSWIIYRSLHSSCNDIRRSLAIILEGSDELYRCHKLRKLMKIVLKIGKMLNGENFMGFSLSNLLQLNGTKAKGKQGSLLHYVIRQCQKHDASVLNFVDQLPSLDFVCRLSVSGIEQELNSLKSGVATLVNEIETARKEPQLALNAALIDRFCTTNFSDMMRDEQENFDLVKTEYEKVVRFFGEDPSEMSCDAFFKLVKEFQRLIQDGIKTLPKQAAVSKTAQKFQQKAANDENAQNVVSST